MINLMLFLWLGVTTASTEPRHVFLDTSGENTDTYIVKNPRFPSGDEFYSPKRWNFTTTPGNSIISVCPILKLGDGYAKDCFTNIIFTDAEGKHEKVCNSQENHYFRTDTNSLSVEMSTGDEDYIIAKCEISVKRTEDVGPPPTVDPHYLSEEWSEEDSSEHGGPPGKRNTTCPCGWANKESKRIVGGKETGVNEFPFMVAVVFTKTKEHFCGGTILTRFHVLTAAHCSDDFLGYDKQISVIPGAHNVVEEEDPGQRQVIAVKKIHQHKKYKHTSRVIKNDISILELEEEILFSKFVGPACLSNVQLNLEGKYVTNAGWGRVGHNQEASSVLKKVKLRVIPLDKCRKKADILDPNSATQICTYASGQSSCSGDSGGPVMWLEPETNRYIVIGLVSFGYICGMYYPNVNTDVTAFYDWIQKTVEDSKPQQEICLNKL